MKIKTEIFKSIFIITCEGDALNPVPIEVFLASMAMLIQKNKLDILVDLSAVKEIEGAKLGAIACSLAKTEHSDFLIVCGVSDRDFSLLRMTNLNEKLTHTTNRNEALSLLYWERKQVAEKNGSTDTSGSLAALEEAVKKSAAETIGTREDKETADGMEGDEDEIYIIGDDDFEIVSSPVVANEGEDKALNTPQIGRRKDRRAKSYQVMDEDFIVFCKNTVTGKHYTAIIHNFSLGGLLMSLSPPQVSKGDELLMEGRMGRLFKFKENVTFHSRRKDGFVFEFKDLSPQAALFIRQVIR